MTAKVKLSTIQDFQTFTQLAINEKLVPLVKQGLYIVDGTSIMGLLSLNPCEPYEVAWTELEYGKFHDFILEKIVME